LTWNGAAWVPQNAPSGADNWGTQSAVVAGPITGNGTAATPLGLIAGGGVGQVLTWNGANWVSQAVPSSADNWGTQSAVTNVTLTGNGTAGNPLGIAQQGAIAGQILTWNGAAWVPQNAPSGADNWGTQSAVVNGPITGNGTAATPLGLIAGAAVGHVLTWNGATWISQAPGSGADNWGTQSAVTTGPITGNGLAGTPITMGNGTANGQVWTWNGAAWVLQIPTATVTANNGLTVNAGIVQLGGPLIQNTDVALAGFNMVWSGAGRFAVGTAAPVNKVHVINAAATGVAGVAAMVVDNQNTGATHAISAFTNSTTAGTVGVRGEHSHPSNSVFGVAGTVTSTNRDAAGVLGTTFGATPNAYGVFGQNTNGTNGHIGVGGLSLSHSAMYAQTASITNALGRIIGATTFDGAAGILAYSTNAAGSGALLVGDGMSLPLDMNYLINGTGANINGFNVGGFSWAANGLSTQVIGHFNTYNGGSFGIAGYDIGFGGFGLVPNIDVGSNNSAFDYGAVGIADDVGGISGFQGEGFNGVVGLMGSPAGWAVFAQGDFGATGVKLFTIDHPEDPEHKMLNHFCLESNEPLNIYRGNITTDANGEATVTLPSYFDDINIEYTYQLTPLGAAANVYIKQKITGNTFVIGGAQPGMEVSWQVAARRNDRHVQQNLDRLQAEVVKTGRYAGRYLNPELYGLPNSMAVFPRLRHQEGQPSPFEGRTKPVLSPEEQLRRNPMLRELRINPETRPQIQQRYGNTPQQAPQQPMVISMGQPVPAPTGVAR
jgi:hypothetical protein